MFMSTSNDKFKFCSKTLFSVAMLVHIRMGNSLRGRR